MHMNQLPGSKVLGLFLFLGLTVLGYLLSGAVKDFKAFERGVTVKGLSEREVSADIVIWPIVFTVADNDLEALYEAIESNTAKIEQFLKAQGIDSGEVSHSLPSITDKSAQEYGSSPAAPFRFTAMQTVTVYSPQVDLVRKTMAEMAELGKSGIVFRGDQHLNQTEYLYNGLNSLKPEMIQEATAKAREVAEKFAQDSNSRLGKIRDASQGQFSITSRDANNPHIKKIRVVSTVTYQLID
ncbi:MAG: SIMPL domain-containing protein [Desulfofustis sp.]|nr:SIMPL domain-containing protein [Desulfofustis sp.]